MLIERMLAMGLVASVPAMTQTVPANDIEARQVKDAGGRSLLGRDASVDPAAAAPDPRSGPGARSGTERPRGGATVGCGILTPIPRHPAGGRAWLITLPDGYTAPVLVRPTGMLHTGREWPRTLIGQGASFNPGRSMRRRCPARAGAGRRAVERSLWQRRGVEPWQRSRVLPCARNPLDSALTRVGAVQARGCVLANSLKRGYTDRKPRAHLTEVRPGWKGCQDTRRWADRIMIHRATVPAVGKQTIRFPAGGFLNVT